MSLTLLRSFLLHIFKIPLTRSPVKGAFLILGRLRALWALDMTLCKNLSLRLALYLFIPGKKAFSHFAAVLMVVMADFDPPEDIRKVTYRAISKDREGTLIVQSCNEKIRAICVANSNIFERLRMLLRSK